MFVGVQLREWDERVIDFWLSRSVPGVGLYIDLNDTDQNFATLADRLNRIGDHGAWPMVTFTAYHTPNRQIIDGYGREKLQRFFGAVRTSIMIRPLHEANGSWYPWRGADAVDAGLTILAATEGADVHYDIVGCWSPNIDYPGIPLPARSMVPDAEHLEPEDYVGFDAYHVRNHDLSVDALTISQQVAQFHQRYSGHAIHLFETGSADTPEHWIEQVANIRWLNGFWWADYASNLGDMTIRKNRKALRALDTASLTPTRRRTELPEENPPPTIPRPTMRQAAPLFTGNPYDGVFANYLRQLNTPNGNPGPQPQMYWTVNGRPAPWGVEIVGGGDDE